MPFPFLVLDDIVDDVILGSDWEIETSATRFSPARVLGLSMTDAARATYAEWAAKTAEGGGILRDIPSYAFTHTIPFSIHTSSRADGSDEVKCSAARSTSCPPLTGPAGSGGYEGNGKESRHNDDLPPLVSDRKKRSRRNSSTHAGVRTPVANVRALRALTIPPLSEVGPFPVTIHWEGHRRYTSIMVSAHVGDSSFLRVGRGIVAVRGNASSVVLSNLSSTPIEVKAGQLLGVGHGVQEDDYIFKETSAVSGNDDDDRKVSDARARSASGLSAGTDETNCPLPELNEIWPSLSERVRTAVRRRGLLKSASELPPHMLPVQFGGDCPLTELQTRLAWTVMADYADVFNDSPTVPSRTSKFRATIDTGGAPPVSSAPFRTSPGEKETIDKAVDEMLAAGVIWPSRSPWSSPVVLVPKKGGDIRFCVDYRRLNALTKIETYPLPRIDETLRAFEGSMFFSVMDMQSGLAGTPRRCLHPKDGIHYPPGPS